MKWPLAKNAVTMVRGRYKNFWLMFEIMILLDMKSSGGSWKEIFAALPGRVDPRAVVHEAQEPSCLKRPQSLDGNQASM